MTIQSVRTHYHNAAAGTAEDPVLAFGELGVEIGTNRLKLGDGVTAWSSLPYYTTQQDVAKVPTVLTDQATLATDCSLGNKFRVTLGGNRTLANPTNMTDGQSVTWELIQDGTGSRTLTLGNKFALGTDISAVTLTTTANKRDFLAATYNASSDKWYVLAFVKGY